MSTHQAAVSGELEPSVTRAAILRQCHRYWPSRPFTITATRCSTCRSRGFEQYQAKVMVNGNCLLKASCENTEEEALEKLWLWSQNYWTWRPEGFH